MTDAEDWWKAASASRASPPAADAPAAAPTVGADHQLPRARSAPPARGRPHPDAVLAGLHAAAPGPPGRGPEPPERKSDGARKSETARTSGPARRSEPARNSEPARKNDGARRNAAVGAGLGPTGAGTSVAAAGAGPAGAAAGAAAGAGAGDGAGRVKSPRRVLPGVPRAAPVSRTALRELVEHATGLGRGNADPAARETALVWMRAGRCDPVDVFRTVVAGPAAADAPFNVRVLAFVQWVMVLGGPQALAAACEATSPRRPSPATRVCLDVLKACGHDSYAPTVFSAAEERMASWSLDPSAAPGASGGDGGAAAGGAGPSAIVNALEMYAVLLGRKLAFHAAHPEVEANYSLDRFYRQLHVENGADAERSEANLVRHGQVISHAMGAEAALLARGSACVAAALDRAKVPIDVVGLVFTNACNSYALARYVLSKTAVAAPPGGAAPAEGALSALEPVREWLARRIKAMEARPGDGLRIVRRFVERNVVLAIEDPGRRPVRPESGHRREVACTFSSFAGLHTALAPAVRL